MRQCIYLFMACCVIIGCTTNLDIPERGSFKDFDPPQYKYHTFSDAKTLEIVYSEAITLTPTLIITPELSIEPSVEDTSVRLDFLSAPQAGVQYTISIEVIDMNENRNRLQLSFYGINEDLPELLITEFTPEGSKTRPDRIELFVTKGGDTTGLTVYTADPGDPETKPIIVFPQIRVANGDFIIIHTKATGASEEKSETERKDSSEDSNTHPNAWDVWVSNPSGLANTSGAIIVSDRPGGEIIDALAYTKRQFDADHQYQGYGRKADLELLQYLRDHGAWRAEDSSIGPHNAIYSDPSTSTRSINRAVDSNNNFIDTDTASDWYIVPTRKSSFGTFNVQEVYIP